MKRVTDKQKRAMMRKARRLAAADLSRKHQSLDIREVLLRVTRNQQSLVFETRTGYFSPRRGKALGLSDLDIVEAIETPNHMAQACIRIGYQVLSHLMRMPPKGDAAKALPDLAEAMAKWMKLDVEALRKELEEEKAADANSADSSEPTVPPVAPTASEGTP